MRTWFLFSAAGLMIVSAAAHSLLGWPTMLHALQQTGVGPDLRGGLAAGWYFGSVAMAAFGAIVLTAAVRWRRGETSGFVFVRVVAVAYLVFGLAAYVSRDFNPHFLLFVLTGVVAGIPVLTRTT